MLSTDDFIFDAVCQIVESSQRVVVVPVVLFVVVGLTDILLLVFLAILLLFLRQDEVGLLLQRSPELSQHPSRWLQFDSIETCVNYLDEMVSSSSSSS